MRTVVSSLWWAVLLAAAAVAATLDLQADTGDLVYFAHASSRLLSGAWADTFADPDLQIGPVSLAVIGVVDRALPLAFAVEIGAVFGVALVTGRLVQGRAHRLWAVRLAAGLATIALGLAHGAYVDGHPAQLFIPLLWLLGAVAAREGRPVRAGALLGLSAGLELWGILGAAVLLLAPGRRSVVTGAATAVAVATALVAPFALAGEFRMFEYDWRVADGTLLGLVTSAGTAFPWPLRLVQGAAALAVGGALAWRVRQSVHALWAVPLATVVVRLLLDPVRYPWYWIALETLVIAAAACLLTDERVVAVLRRRAPAATPR